MNFLLLINFNYSIGKRRPDRSRLKTAELAEKRIFDPTLGFGLERHLPAQIKQRDV